MATPDVMQHVQEGLLSSPFRGPPKGTQTPSAEDAKSWGQSIEKKIEFLENLNGKVSNRRSRRWLNDRLLMELVPRLNADEIRGLFAPPPFGDDQPLSPFCMTNMGEWETFRNIDMDKQARIIDGLNRSSSPKSRGNVDDCKVAALNAWRRIDCRTREAIRRSFLTDLIQGYEACIRDFLQESDDEVLALQVQDPFHRLLLHGVCEVDAFTDSPFKGNPAAVCLLEEDKDEKWLQAVAAEFNISETCYLTRITANSTPRFSLRWFTPVTEVELCGHATLAAAHTLFSNGLVDSNIIEFDTLSGILTAKKVPQISKTDVSSNQNSQAVDCFLIELNFPSDSTAESNSVDLATISKALNGASAIDIRTTTSDDLLVVLPSAKAVTEIQPQLDEIFKFPGRGVIVSGVAPSESGFDFYSRFFCPKFGINEDPVCGSAHCALATYWSKKLGKCDLMAYQASPRGGILDIHLDEANQRVLLRGKAATVMEGYILV
ncbi:Phenazine biosynthesis-like domain-containing protein [Euphorbia peplus]|nr:Phenazine biosynthesis-like domain-containing protein [Euphorbia peplus]